MKRPLNRKSRLVGSLLGLAGIFAGGNAFAYDTVVRSYSDGDTAGNTHFRASYGWWGYTINNTETTGTPARAAHASQALYGDVRVFGKNFRALDASVEALVRHNTAGYEKYQAGRLALAGSTLFDQQVWNQTCPGKSAAFGCTSFSRSISKTLLSAKGTFTLIVPITVTASVAGGLRGSLDAKTTSTTFLSGPNSFNGWATAGFTAGAFVSSHQSVSGGVPYIFEVGLGLDLTLIDLAYEPKMEAYQTLVRNGATTVGRRGHNNYDWVGLTTLSGQVKIFAELLGQEIDSLTLLSWNGYVWEGAWVNDKSYEDLVL